MMKTECNVHTDELYQLLESTFFVSRQLVANTEKGDIYDIENLIREQERLLLTIHNKLERVDNSRLQNNEKLKVGSKYLQLLYITRVNLSRAIKVMEKRKDDAIQNIQNLQKRKSIAEYMTR